MAPLCKGSCHGEAVTEGLPPHSRFAPLFNRKTARNPHQRLPLHKGAYFFASPSPVSFGFRLRPTRAVGDAGPYGAPRTRSVGATLAVARFFRLPPLSNRKAEKTPHQRLPLHKGAYFFASPSPVCFGFRLRPTRAVGDAGPYGAPRNRSVGATLAVARFFRLPPLSNRKAAQNPHQRLPFQGSCRAKRD